MENERKFENSSPEDFRENFKFSREISNSDLSLEGSDDFYYDHCDEVVQKLLNLNGKFKFQTNDTVAFFVPLSIWEEFQMDIQNQGISIEDSWDYDLKIGDKIVPTNIVWILGCNEQEITIDSTVKIAFSFLQPHYLHYMDKPFRNRDVFTQVNLVLDYHRKLKRRRRAEIFNIIDLVVFKMAIDDNRLEYENCEFHKLIEKEIAEVVIKGKQFDLNIYLHNRFEFRENSEYIHYLIYHFQDQIGYIYWYEGRNSEANINLANIENVTTFLENFKKIGQVPTFGVAECDASGKSAKILFEILTKTTKEIDFRFYLHEWPYSRDDTLNKITDELLANCKITISIEASFGFVEDFTNWIKFMFGARATDFISLKFNQIEITDPYIFIDFYIKDLEFEYCTLDYELIKVLKACKYGKISIFECKIVDYSMQRFDLITPKQIGCEKNIFKFLDELDNVWEIRLKFEDNTLETLLTYAASVMTEKKLMEFQLKNEIKIDSVTVSKFQWSSLGTGIEKIDVCSSSGARIDFYETYNELALIDREEFDFYQ